MAVTITDPLADDLETRSEMYGDFSIEDANFQMTHLWLLDVGMALDEEGGAGLPPEEEESDDDSDSDNGDEGENDDADKDDDSPPAFRQLTEGEFTVDNYSYSPDGSRIAFSHLPDTRVSSFENSDISVVDVESAEVVSLVARDAFDGNPIWSPDGDWILFDTSDGDFNYFVNGELARIPSEGGDIEVLTADFDREPSSIAWLEDGIRFSALDAPKLRLYKLDPATKAVTPLTDDPPTVWGGEFSLDGSHMAFAAEGPDIIDEIFLAAADGSNLQRLTDRTSELAPWDSGGREMIQWTSHDGATIEGVLSTPPNFDPSKKHPLLVIIHGGPTWASMPYKIHTYVYPVQQWLAKGAVILEPNYRGSQGYGEEFKSLNVRNLGVGDAWDVMSGVEHLVDQGFIDEERMGAMGWSQGGYISAFLTTTTDEFKAISVGAGISNWMTYYVNTDIHPFTRYYLEGDPWEEPEIYAVTSPMTYILDAQTPTLIQHGENDARVPTPNAYELFQGLEDVGVETKLIIYKGFGHGITKPKERLAAVWHNWEWFARHVWGEEVEMPLE
jgi:dipeptidyl aminopeptidase/acylaminoacyl peptidase